VDEYEPLPSDSRSFSWSYTGAISLKRSSRSPAASQKGLILTPVPSELLTQLSLRQ
jgi:hypothetical protein